MINPQVASADYSQLTNAVIRGEDTKLQASKEKNARIRASLAEVTMNNRASADAQASWMGAISQNESLLNALNKAPPRIQKAYNRATQGRATLEDNSVISSYLRSIENQIELEKKTTSGNLNNELVQAQIAQAEASRDASTAKMKVSNAELSALNPAPGTISPRQKTINTLLGNPPGSAAPVANAGGGAPVPPVANINATATNDPVARPVTGLALPEPAPIPTAPTGQSLVDNNPFAPQAPVTAPQAPTAAPQAPAAAPAQSSEVDPNAGYFTDSEGNVVVASSRAVNSPEVAQEVAKGLTEGDAVQKVQGRIELKKSMNEYVNGRGNTDNLPTANMYTAQLYAATGDLDDAREQTEAAISQGLVYAGPTSKEKSEREKEFKDSYNAEIGGLASLLSDTQVIQNAKGRVDDNIAAFSSGFVGASLVKLGMDFPFDGGNAVEMQRAISQLTSSSALSTMQELKDNSKQGATGLGQVAVKEFEALMDKASSINQYLQPKALKAAVGLYVYDRNKAAYNTYRSMVDQYGAAAVNSQPGISSRQLSRILEDINTFEMTEAVGITAAARNGYFIDNVGVPQAPRTIQSGPGGAEPVPAPAVSREQRNEQAVVAAEEVFEQKKAAKEARSVEGLKTAAMLGAGMMSPQSIPAIVGTYVAPKLYNFFPDGSAQTESYSKEISNIQTK